MAKRTVFMLSVLTLILTILVGACSPQAEAPAVEQPADEGIVEEEQPAEEPEAEEPADAPMEEAEPTADNTLVSYFAADKDTFDPHKTTNSGGTEEFGGTLIAKHPETGEYVPYLAERWEASEDGLTLTFYLRDDVKFHDGTPLTAEDFAWTFMRAIAPETASPAAGTLLGGLTEAVALDDLTLQLTLAAPNFWILESLSLAGFMQPLSKAYVEANGEDALARNPMGVGPYIFVEYETGDHVLYKRNPEFTWGPEYAPGPVNFQFLEYRIIPDQATALAAFEAGEIHAVGIPPEELDRFSDESKYAIYQSMGQLLFPAFNFNLSKAPWDDVNMRKAINYAINRQLVIDVVYGGNAEIAYGPIVPAMAGYWPGVEEIGYTYDLEKAYEHFELAGYVKGEEWLEKDGEPLSFSLITPNYDFILPVLEVVQQQLIEVGVDFKIEAMDASLVDTEKAKGEFDMAVTGYSYPTADVLYFFHHSSMLGALNWNMVADPDLDAMLDASRTTMDPTAQQEITNDIQKYIVENAYVVPLVNEVSFTGISTQVQGYYWSEVLVRFDLSNAYLVTDPPQ